MSELQSMSSEMDTVSVFSDAGQGGYGQAVGQACLYQAIAMKKYIAVMMLPLARLYVPQ
jgi:hypothetical protein